MSNFSLSTLSPNPGAKTKPWRKGIGEGSGNGKTCGRGHKGQKKSGKAKKGFEGGQMPLHRRLPKIGFTSVKKRAGINLFRIVTLSQLDNLAKQSGSNDISLDQIQDFLSTSGKICRVKIVSNGALTSAVNVQVNAVTASALAAVEAAGGKVSIVE